MPVNPFMRRAARVLWDCMAWVVATLIVVGARYDFFLNDVLWSRVVRFILAACVLQVIVGNVLMLYPGRYRIATLAETLGLALTAAVGGALLVVGLSGFWQAVAFPRATAVSTPPVAILLMAAGRWAYRAWRDRISPNAAAENVLISGAGGTLLDARKFAGATLLTIGP